MVDKRDVDRYINDARQLSQILCGKFHTRYPLSAWIQDKVPQNGVLEDDIEYYYHGHGCTFTKNSNEEYELNLDYWNDNIVLHPDKIFYFIKGEFTKNIEIINNILYFIKQREDAIIESTIFGEKYIINIFQQTYDG